MRIVTTTSPFDHILGTAEAVRLICEAGFTGIDLSMSSLFGENYKELLKDMRVIADSYAVPFVQSHGPIPKFAYDDLSGRNEFLRMARRSIELAGELGIENVIFHPVRFSIGAHADQMGYNLDLYGELISLAESADTHIAIENMCGYKRDINGARVEHVCKNATELSAYIDAFGSDRVVACLDTGHAFISGHAPDMFVRELGKERLKALHIHDSDGISDLHTLPYLAGINWSAFTVALKDIDYSGCITLEAVNFTEKMPVEFYKNALSVMEATARQMRNSVLGK